MISPGSKLFSSSRDDHYGLAGPIVKDSVGTLLMLTSRELLSRGIKLYNENVGVADRPSSYFHAEGTISSGLQLVGWFRPSSHVIVDDDYLPPSIANSSEVLLSTGIAIPAIASGACGYICGTNCSARFHLSDIGGPTTFKGLLRASALSDDRPLGLPGVAGAEVFTEAGALVGIVVGTASGDVLFAPLDEVLAAEGLELANLEDIKLHNDSIRNEPISDKAPEPLQKILTTLPGDHIFSQDAIVAWIETGWHSHLTGVRGAFAPYEQYFKSVGTDPLLLIQRLWEFGLSTLSSAEMTRVGWEQILRRAHSMIDATPEAEQNSTSRGSQTGQSSHDIVVGGRRAA